MTTSTTTRQKTRPPITHRTLQIVEQPAGNKRLKTCAMFVDLRKYEVTKLHKSCHAVGDSYTSWKTQNAKCRLYRRHFTFLINWIQAHQRLSTSHFSILAITMTIFGRPFEYIVFLSLQWTYVAFAFIHSLMYATKIHDWTSRHIQKGAWNGWSAGKFHLFTTLKLHPSFLL